MDVFTCQCGKSFRRKCDISKHQRYYCRGVAPEADHGNICSICSREFNTRIGLRQHQRLSHPTEYNEEIELSDDRAYNSWSAMEDYELAVEEIAYDGININQHLARIFTHRTVESIKGHRRSKTYKDYVEKLRLERQEAADYPEPIQHRGRENRNHQQPLETVMEDPSTVSYEYIPDEVDNSTTSGPADEFVVNSPQQFAFNASLPVASPLSSPVEHSASLTAEETSTVIDLSSSPELSLHLDPLATSFTVEPSDDVRRYITELLMKQDFPVDLLEPVSLCLDDNTLGLEVLNMLLDRIHKLANPKPQSQPMPHHSSTQTLRKKYRGNARRAYIYKKAQKLYRSNRAHLANSIFEGTLDSEVDNFPDIAAVEDSYRKLLETPSITDSNYISDFVDHNIKIYRPIWEGEVKKVLGKRMSEAAGVDQLTPSDLKKIPTTILTCLFNLMLFLGNSPSELKKCRTTLIPKGDSDLRDVNNWRPITVTSVILRIFNKILAGRFKDLPFHHSQKGFLEVDGTLANTMTLQATIKSCRRLCRPHCITTLDLKKAFDSVSCFSIQRALERFRIEEKVVRLIMNTYDGTTTNIRCGPNVTGDLKMLRGVKQGDPLSPLLFNLVMDELLVELHKLPPGISIEGASLTVLAYADDLVLFTENPATAQMMVRRCEKFLAKRQMELNANKCTSLTAKLLPNRKKLYISTRSSIYANGGLIPAISVGDQFKYLGFKFSFVGTEKPRTNELHHQLRSVCKSPLKPHQKLNIINFYLLPRYMYILQAPNISSKTLLACDKSIRYSVKKILHLPSSTPNSFLYAPLRSGGLGITSFTTKIPGILQRRIRNLQESSMDDNLLAMLGASYVTERLAVYDGMLRDVGLSRTSENTFWSFKLETSICGNGISSVGNFSGCSSWVFNPPPFWSGKDYINAILLRGNLLPVKGGVHNAPTNRSCRAGCSRTESMSHVLQKCPATHFERISRHDRIVQAIASNAKNRGWEVQVEPRLRDSTNTLRKPDLVLVNREHIVVCDVGIHWEGPEPLQSAAMDKIRHYNDRHLEGTLLERFPSRTLLHLPFILGARGGWWSGNNELCELTNINDWNKRTIVLDLLKGGWSIHRAFSTKVWERRR